jgi:hypothetical protein
MRIHYSYYLYIQDLFAPEECFVRRKSALRSVRVLCGAGECLAERRERVVEVVEEGCSRTYMSISVPCFILCYIHTRAESTHTRIMSFMSFMSCFTMVCRVERGSLASGRLSQRVVSKYSTRTVGLATLRGTPFRTPLHATLKYWCRTSSSRIVRLVFRVVRSGTYGHSCGSRTVIIQVCNARA